MNSLSFTLILLFGILIGFVFQDLLKELGVSEKRAHSFITVFGLTFIAFLGYLLLPFLIYGSFQLNPMESLYASEYNVFLMMMFCVFIGGIARLGFYHFLKVKKI